MKNSKNDSDNSTVVIYAFWINFFKINPNLQVNVLGHPSKEIKDIFNVLFIKTMIKFHTNDQKGDSNWIAIRSFITNMK